MKRSALVVGMLLPNLATGTSCDAPLTRELLIETGSRALEARARDARRTVTFFVGLVLPDLPDETPDPVLIELNSYLEEEYGYSKRAAWIHRLFKDRFGEMPNHHDVLAAAPGSRLYVAIAEYLRALELETIKLGQRDVRRFHGDMEVQLFNPQIRMPIRHLKPGHSIYVMQGNQLSTALVRKIEKFEGQPYGTIQTPRETLRLTAGQALHTYDGVKAAGDLGPRASFIRLDAYGYRLDSTWARGGVWEPAPEPAPLYEVTLDVPYPFFVQGYLVEGRPRE